MYIQINNEPVSVSIAYSADRLSLNFTAITDNLLDLYELFQPNTMPEITVYDEINGNITSAIYANHKVVAFHIMDQHQVQIDLQVDPLEIGEARRISETLQAQLQDMIENNVVLNEMLTMLADHEERIKALEPSESNEEPEETNEGDEE